MINRDNIFLLSGIFSVGFYFLFIFIFFIYSRNCEVKKISLSSKETFLELEVVNTKSNKLSNKHFSKQIKLREQTTNSGKLNIKTKSISTKRVTNLKSLFAKVKTKSININKAKSLNIQGSSEVSRYKSKFEKHRKEEISKILKSMENTIAKPNLNNEKQQYDVDKYYSKIKEILTLRWYTWNSIVVNNLTAKVVIFIDTSGHFSYRILKYFGQSLVDNNLETFLDSETSRLYPIPKKNESIEIIFKLEKE